MEVKDRPNPHHPCRRKSKARGCAFYPLSSACNLQLGEKQEWEGYLQLQLSLGCNLASNDLIPIHSSRPLTSLRP